MWRGWAERRAVGRLEEGSVKAWCLVAARLLLVAKLLIEVSTAISGLTWRDTDETVFKHLTFNTDIQFPRTSFWEIGCQ